MTTHLSIAEYKAALRSAGHSRHRHAQPEYDAQVRFFVLVDWLAELSPAHAGELEDVWATSNGGKRPRGEAGRMRAAGQRKGVLDIECMVPRNGVHGLFIEMKSETGRATKEQNARIRRLMTRGYLAVIARSWQEAGQMLCNYLELAWPTSAEAHVEWRLLQRRKVRKAERRGRWPRHSARRETRPHRPAHGERP